MVRDGGENAAYLTDEVQLAGPTRTDTLGAHVLSVSGPTAASNTITLPSTRTT